MSEGEKMASIETRNNNQIKNKKNDDYQLVKEYLRNVTDEIKFKFWIKTLLSSYSTFPEIIKTIDKIIELQASSLTFASDIYNKNKSTLSQVEKVIDLTERKNSLLNVYIMIKEMIKKLSEDESELLEKKFMYNWSADDLAREYSVSTRTIYRKIDKLIDQIFEYCIKHKWTLKFIEIQIKDEGWLKEKFIKIVNDYIKNINYKAIELS